MYRVGDKKKKKEKEREKRDLGPRGFVLIRLDATGLFEIAGGESCVHLSICAGYLKEIPKRKSPGEGPSVSADEKRKPGDFPEGKTRKKSSLSSSSGGSDLWPSVVEPWWSTKDSCENRTRGAEDVRAL